MNVTDPKFAESCRKVLSAFDEACAEFGVSEPERPALLVTLALGNFTGRHCPIDVDRDTRLIEAVMLLLKERVGQIARRGTT